MCNQISPGSEWERKSVHFQVNPFAFCRGHRDRLYRYLLWENTKFLLTVRLHEKWDSHPEERSSYQSKGCTLWAHWGALTRRELPLTPEDWKHVLRESLLLLFHKEDSEMVKSSNSTCLDSNTPWHYVPGAPLVKQWCNSTLTNYTSVLTVHTRGPK